MLQSLFELTANDITRHQAELAGILIDCVEQGASISFMAPLSKNDAIAFWMNKVQPSVQAGERIVWGVQTRGALTGTVQLITDMPPNQPHRCEIAKMMVHPSARRQGLGRLLMQTAIDRARQLGKTLVTLDTRTGDAGEPLYRSLGFQTVGVIPDYAWDPDGSKLSGTTLMYLALPDA